ncbi:hypothetical protein GCM10008019_08400 [Deinococcus soli (ex Cha et al. 2016)]|nr:hypothetical protein GCM10008019_08400 [Deinococcus soli (ex Cha et al. 2016)]
MEIDFKKLKFCDSCGSLIFAQTYRRLKIYVAGQISIELINAAGPAFEYMKFMGCFGDDFQLPQYTPNFRYIPVTIQEKAKFLMGSSGETGEILDEKGLSLAKVLLQQPDRQLEEVIQYSLREIMRNVYEHAQADYIGYSAQYYPNRKLVEMTIFDDGQGLLRSLAMNPYMDISSSRAAVCAAFLPGVSGKMFKGVKKRNSDPWQNSGFGLYMLRRFAQNCGKMMLFTNDSGIVVEGNDMTNVAGWHKGTVVYLQLQVDKIGNLATMLSDFREEGEKKAGEIRGEKVTASTASVMLSSQIQKEQ